MPFILGPSAGVGVCWNRSAWRGEKGDLFEGSIWGDYPQKSARIYCPTAAVGLAGAVVEAFGGAAASSTSRSNRETRVSSVVAVTDPSIRDGPTGSQRPC
jgi:hypothetical protein